MNISLLAILAVVTFISAFIQGSLGIGFALIRGACRGDAETRPPALHPS